MLQDVRLALRQLWRSPGFTAIVVLTLALAIGGTTAIFALIEAVLLRPLAHPQPERIVTLWSQSTRDGHQYRVSAPDFRDFHDQTRPFSALARYTSGTIAVAVGQSAETVGFATISAELFTALGATPAAGRLFTEEERRTSGVVVVGDRFARRHFGGGDPASALGGKLRAAGRAWTIVGVMPAGFRFPEDTEVWTPILPGAMGEEARSAQNYRVVGRLRPEVTLAQAQAEVSALAATLEKMYPDTNTARGARLVRLHDLMVGDHRATLWMVLGAVALVLLIACANIANLLLARGARRRHEVAVRAALGAGRARIARQLLTESLVLAALGSALGLVAAAWGLEVLLAIAPRGIPRLDEVTIDRATLLFTGALCLTVCLLVGALPAAQAIRTDLGRTLGATSRALKGTRGRLRGLLVIAQLAVSLVLLTGAGLLLRSLQKLSSVDPGYRSDNVLVMRAEYPASMDHGSAAAAAFFDELLRRTRTLSGIEGATVAGSLPIGRGGSDGMYSIEGRPDLAPHERSRREALWKVVGPGYFALLGVPVRAGREVGAGDAAGAPAVVVINESMARAAWPGESPLGRRIRIGWYPGMPQWMTIVGVVADTRQRRLDRPISQELYLPAAQHPRITTTLSLVARTTNEPLAQAETLRQLVRALNPEVPLTFSTARAMIDDTLNAPRFRSILLALFAAVALVLALVGMAGVMAYLVAERRGEIGVRMAIGARPEDILRHFLGRAARLALVGLVLGMAGSLAAARLIEDLLYGVTASDPRILAAVGASMFAAALLAAAIPALRAARVSPMTVLRTD
jgi:putative ABC transport system permease protein